VNHPRTSAAGLPAETTTDVESHHSDGFTRRNNNRC
jgi:hypothetical protein